MRYVAEYSISVNQTGRTISDDAWEEIEAAHIRTWKAAIALLKERTFQHKTTRYVVETDWLPILQRHQKDFTALTKHHKNIAEGVSDPWQGVRFPSRSSRIRIKVRSDRDNSSYLTRDLSACAIYDTFFILNIASPSCCNLYKARFTDDRYGPNIDLSNILFESALDVFLIRSWPIIRTLDLQLVTRWYDSVRNGISQVPQNPMERVIFALLHISRMDLSPMTVVWLFYAFESLFQTRVGENFSSLLKRLSLLLEPPQEEMNRLKKGLRSLYDMRSSIVHGGFEVSHPLHAENIDKRVEEGFGRLITTTDYGFALLISAIQRTIERGWKWPIFEERVDGIPF